MTRREFNEITPKLIEAATRNRLGLTFIPDFNDELDFIIDLDTEAMDYQTLENPTCTDIASYLIVEMPKIVRDDDELRRIAEREGYKPQPDVMINNYNYAATQLMSLAKPQYLLGVENGHVDKLMWCVWLDD